MTRCFMLILAIVFSTSLGMAQNAREKKVREDKVKVEEKGFWIYNDLPKAFDEAKKTGKPMVVVLRCIPCEECVKLDDDLVDENPKLQELLKQFVRVRVVSTNGLDLSLFQYDTDQSFAVFFLNADQTIYGRFGTRSHRTNWVGDVSIDGLAQAMQGALELHKNYPANREVLIAKRGPTPDYPSPEKIPTLGKYSSKIDYTGNVVQSCIHCHQIGEGLKSAYRAKKTIIPDQLLFPYPHPKSLGMILDPKERATLTEVTAKSLAEQTGLKAGDKITAMNGQPLLSMADVQWVLHHTPATGGKVSLNVIRSGKSLELSLNLPEKWRELDDISWRASTWGLRRMALGGFSVEALAEAPKEGMPLRIKHVGQFGPHAAAKNAGFLAGDQLISFGKQTTITRETDLISYSLRTYKSGEKIPVEIMRAGKKMTLMLPVQD